MIYSNVMQAPHSYGSKLSHLLVNAEKAQISDEQRRIDGKASLLICSLSGEFWSK